MNEKNWKKSFVFLISILFLGTGLTHLACDASTHQGMVTGSLNEGSSTTMTLARQGLRVDGLAPVASRDQVTPQQSASFGGRGYFYAYKASPSPYGTITFDNPGNIQVLSTTGPSFMSGSDIDEQGDWYGVAYYGGIYALGFDGSITQIAPSIAMNGLVFDSANGNWYGCDATNLYTVNILTGATTIVGPLGTANTIIGLACDRVGNMYAYDVLFSGLSTLYSIDATTGHATAIGSMGVGFLYAQDPAYDRDDDILYIAGYTQSGTGGLYTCDTDTGEVSLVGWFQGNFEIDALTIPWMPTDDCIALLSIKEPKSQDAKPINPILKVQNKWFTPFFNVPVNSLISRAQVDGTVDDFESSNGSYTHEPKLPQPDAWQWGTPTYANGPVTAYSGANCWGTNLAGDYPPSMWCTLETPVFTVPAGTMLSFWTWYYLEGNYDGGNVKISTDNGTTWTLITPVLGYPGLMLNNPYMTGQACFTGQSGGWIRVLFDLSTYEGQEIRLRFETASESSVQYAGWYIDDVGFATWINEYNMTVIIPVINSGETMNVTFPTWVPTDLGLVENTAVDYKVDGMVILPEDYYPNNNYRSKLFTLHYGYFDDVALTEIMSPVSGLAETQTPKVAIVNNGQNDESVNVNMVIGKAIYITLLEEDFAGGVPPAGWGTNYPSNWLSSSTNYAGGTAPEAEFYYSPSSVGEHILYTMPLDTTGYTALLLRFKEYVNDYNGGYTLKIVTSVDGGATWETAWSRPGGPYGPATTEISLSTANGVGSDQLMIGWDMSGDSFNINDWFIDDVFLGTIDLVEEYNQTVTTGIDIEQTMNISFPDWTPADVPLATTIDYFVDASVSMGVPDEHPLDNELTTLITLRYEHDVGVVEITEPRGSDRPGPTPGTYPLAALVHNFGVTYPESDIPVNAKITHLDNNTVIYNMNVTLPGPLTPNETTEVSFPEFTIYNSSGWVGEYKIEVKTMLPGDDHPNNDKKTLTYGWEWDTVPPVTNCTLSGTMGNADWYITTVLVTLSAQDLGYPASGVNETNYKVDDGSWTLYLYPFQVTADGVHTVFFYSEDNYGNVEQTQNVSFKIDATPPAVSLNVTKTGGLLHPTWLFNITVYDAFGVAAVEIFIDNVSVANLTVYPWVFEYAGSGKNAQAAAYDLAGNKGVSPVVQAYESGEYIQKQTVQMIVNKGVLLQH